MFEANFFDTGRLFGMYRPAEDADSDRLLVICPPLFDEYRRCYRALAELAKGCSAAGHPSVVWIPTTSAEALAPLHDPPRHESPSGSR